MYYELTKSELLDKHREINVEYDYLISDEAVAEALEANNYFNKSNKEEEENHGICINQR
jgi:hypothetical protein